MSPILPPSTNPTLNPTLPPTLNPTSWNDYTLQINSQFIIQCQTKNSFNLWFNKNTYHEFDHLVTHIFSEVGSIYLQFYQFYMQSQTINQLFNVSLLPVTFNGNINILQEISPMIANIYGVQIFSFNTTNNYKMGIILQFKILTAAHVHISFCDL